MTLLTPWTSGPSMAGRRRLVAAIAIPLLVAVGCGSPATPDLAALRASAPTEGPGCHPAWDARVPQFVVGYGSLMQERSREATTPRAKDGRPIDLVGFRRGFFAQGAMPGFNTVFLGVVPSEQSEINAVLFEVPPDEIPALDDREYFYCRVLVPPSAVTMVDGSATPVGQTWIYVNLGSSLGLASEETPLVQSYVDVFLSGCLELEDEFGVTGFAERCVRTTTDWSPHWVNDRQFPRRPTSTFPPAKRVDAILKALLPEEFAAIRIE